jgi:hypothetical protein
VSGLRYDVRLTLQHKTTNGTAIWREGSSFIRFTDSVKCTPILKDVINQLITNQHSYFIVIIRQQTYDLWPIPVGWRDFFSVTKVTSSQHQTRINTINPINTGSPLPGNRGANVQLTANVYTVWKNFTQLCIYIHYRKPIHIDLYIQQIDRLTF